MAASFMVWLVLALLVFPAAEGVDSGSPLYQHLLGAAFVIWMLWALAAMAFDRSRRRARLRRT
jgi:hypothetical protein